MPEEETSSGDDPVEDQIPVEETVSETEPVPMPEETEEEGSDTEEISITEDTAVTEQETEILEEMITEIESESEEVTEVPEEIIESDALETEQMTENGDTEEPESELQIEDTELSTEVSSEPSSEETNMETDEAENETEEPETVFEETELITEAEMSEETELETESLEEIEMELGEELLLMAAEAESEAETENEDPVPDKFKLINTGELAAVPNSYQSSSVPGGAATQIRKVVFTDDDGSKVTRWAFCIQPNLECPPGGTYDKDSDQVEILETGTKEKTLAKCLYYMYGGPAWGKTIDYADGSGSVNMKSLLEKNGCSTKDHFFAVTHYVLGYVYVGANGNWNANSGIQNVMNSVGKEKIALFVSYIKKLPVPKTELTQTSVTSTSGTGVNVSETVTYKAIDENVATIKLPDGITLVNETTGERSTGTVKISGGTKFHLEADPGIVGSGSYTLSCKYAVDFTAMALKTKGKQDVGFSYYSGDKTITLSVAWPDQAEVSITKKDASTGVNLAGAVYGLYSDAACTNLIVQMPATDSNGVSSVSLIKTQDVVYLKEITAPSGYIIDKTAHNIELVAGDTVTKTVTDTPQLAGITIYKEGEVLTGANVSDSGITFLYEKRRLQGAVYQVTAGADIKNASGSVVYKKGAVVAERLTTGADGSVTINNLLLGTYLVAEKAAPVNFINKGETKTLTLSYAGQNETAVFGSATFVNERKKAEVSVVKQDETTATPLSGAVYGLYAGADIRSASGKVVVSKDTLLGRVTTAENGIGVFKADLPAGNSYYVKELQAPNLYILNTTDVFTFSFTDAECKDAVTAFSHCFKNKEAKGSLTVYKEGEVLTGAEITETGVTFRYEQRKQKGAIYDVYAGEDIRSAVGTVIYKKGELVAENLITGDGGSVTLDDLYLGTYVIKEVQAPENFINKEESKTVTIAYAGQNAAIVFEETTFINERQKASVTVNKKDQDTGNPLSGGIYGIYAGSDIKNADGEVVVLKDTLIEKAVTDLNGSAAYASDLPVGNSYYLKEVQAPENYYRNTTDVYSFTFTYSHDREFVQNFEHTFANERVDATIRLVKKDAETGMTAQGDATLEGAVYGLYAREDIIHPDGRTGVVFKAGTKVAALTTDENGKAEITGLYLGHYFIKEITPSTGYLLDKTEYDILCSYEGDMAKTVERDCTSPETVIKQPFQIIKAADNGKTDADLLEGAGFTAYLISSLKVNGDGSYDYDSAKPVVIGENGATELFTDKKGHAVSIPLPYGTYLVRETTTPHNFTPVKDFIVRITENHPNEPQTWRVLLDDEFEAKLKIIKKDDETKKPVLLAGTEFRIYDMDAKSYVEQVTTYPTTVTHSSYFTDADGYLILPQNLKIGHYRIEEVAAPQGYTINPDYVEIEVDTDTMYQMDAVSGDAIIEVVYENHPVKGELTVVKKGEVLTGYKDDFLYEIQNLSGAVFSVYAAEDIYTADFQKDENGNRVLEYAKDTLVAELTTGAAGTAVLSNLPLGAYKVVEKRAPEGFVHNEEEQYVEFVYVDQNTPVIPERVEFVNDRQKVEISVIKKDVENGNALSGAEFALFAKEDIKAGGKVAVEAGELIETVVTGSDGKAVFTKDLPFGMYQIQEVAAPAGFVSNNTILDVEVSYQGQDVEVVYEEAEFKNLPTVTAFTKSDLTTNVELDGATLTVLDKKGNVIETWTSVKDEPHVIKRLHVGETYILREEFAPHGYLKTEEVEFTISDTADIQKVEMKDDVPTGRIIINKLGEFVGEVTWNDMVAGAVESAFGYITGSLQGVTFEVYALEDIKAADGVSDDYYKKDELVSTITTDALGFARADDLPLGRYYVVEKETVNGFVLDGEPREIDLTYRDQDTPVVTYDEDWQNNRQRAKVTVWKKEKGTDQMLEGGVFALCTKEDITNADGKVIMKAGTVIEQRTTDQDGKILFLADLPVGESFFVQEVQAPDGFVTTEEIQEFTFEYAGADTAEVAFEFTFENEATVFEITKSDLVNGEEIPGARLQVTDESGNVVDEWTSGTTPHVIKELVAGKSYTLTERIPANGYVTAESITFTVENTTDIQKVDMKDDVTKVQIHKTDITGTQGIPGAKLTIFDKEGTVVESWISGEEPHYIEKLPIGTYILREEQAPEGYVTTEDVEFEVLDTGEIQTVTMVNETAKGRLTIYKMDEDTKEPLKGVVFELRNSKGKVIEKLVTDANGQAQSSLLDIATFKEGVYQKALKYVLVETKALDGYALDETEHEIQFTYEDDQTPVIRVELKLTNEKISVPQVSDPPKTGDDTNLWLPLLLMAVSGAALLGIRIYSKKKSLKK